MLDAYRRARDAVNLARPGCHLPVELLAAIGMVETRHARDGQVDSHGTTLRPILGPVLDGRGLAAIPDTDGGTLDGDTRWDRAVGPMQIIPDTWRRWAVDGNGDRRADPHNVYDASLAAARYLCAANRDLGTPQGLDEAIRSYNHSTNYRNLLLRWIATYAGGTTAVPDAGLVPLPALAIRPPTSGPPAPGTSAPASAAPTAPVPSPPTAVPTTVPPTGTTPPPADGPAAPPSPAPPSHPTNPIQDLVCGVGNLVGGLLGPITGPCSPAR